MSDNPADYLAPTPTVASDHPAVVAFAQEAAAGAKTDQEKAVALYYAVRDRFPYNPYQTEMTPEGLTAEGVLEKGHGWCVTKAVLLAAACRAMGVPARLGFADVRNHLSTARMRETMKTDVFYYHGYTSIYLNGAWLKATPAFNVELCEKFGLHALEFDGTEDSIYHPYDLAGNRHMEYLNMRGEFADVPLNDMLQTFREKYTYLEADLGQADFAADVAAETA